MKQGPTIEGFIAFGEHNEWLRTPHMSVYVRKARRRHNTEWFTCLDIANIQVCEKKQRQGMFTAWLEYVEETLPKDFKMIYIENLLNDHLRNLLNRRNYAIIPGIDGLWPDSAFKLINLGPKPPLQSA